MRKIVLASGTLALGLAACAPVAPLPGVPTGECSTARLGGLVGRPASGALLGRAKRLSGASVVRTLRPGQIVTMDYRNGRLNANVNDRNIVKSFACG